MCEMEGNGSMECGYCDVVARAVGKMAEKVFVVDSHNEYAELPMRFCPACGVPLVELDPLTLDELREMGSQAVWDSIGRRWVLVDASGKKRTIDSEGYIHEMAPNRYYQRPPREG